MAAGVIIQSPYKYFLMLPGLVKHGCQSKRYLEVHKLCIFKIVLKVLVSEFLPSMCEIHLSARYPYLEI
jgi:hypothetical protein